jgi:hypothetical protein
MAGRPTTHQIVYTIYKLFLPLSFTHHILCSGQGLTANTPLSHYYYSTSGPSILRIPLHLSAGDVGIYYLTESSEDVGEGAAVKCWVDDDDVDAVKLENSSESLKKGEVKET